MPWATPHISALKEGRTVRFRPRGNSMAGKIRSGQLVEVAPLDRPLEVGDIVLCSVRGADYLHLVKALQGDRVLIGNNRGYVNGWTTRIHGRLTALLD